MISARTFSNETMILAAVVFLSTSISLPPAFGQRGDESLSNGQLSSKYEVWGIEYGVSDLEQAIDFYIGALGFQEDEGCCVLRNGPVRLALEISDAAPSLNGTAGAYLNMNIGDFDIVIEKVKAFGGKVLTTSPRRFALGTSVAIQDPSGNHINLLKIDDDPRARDSVPEVFNIGLRQLDLKEAEAFYAGLGFTPYSRDYLPLVLPLTQKGATMLILHGSAEFPADEGTLNGQIVLKTNNVGANGEESNAQVAEMMILRDPAGNKIKVLGREETAIFQINSKSKSSSEWSALQTEVLRAVESYTRASHERDLERYLAAWHDDFLGWHNGDRRPTDKKMREKGLAHYFNQTESIEYGLNPLNIQIIAGGKAAIVHFELRNILKSKSTGKKYYGLSYWTDFLVKESGQWLLISDHGGDSKPSVSMADRLENRIDYIEIPATDIDSAKKFYSNVFGWDFVAYGDDYASFNDGRIAGGLRKEPVIQKGGPLIVFYAKQLESLQSRIRNAGGTVTKEIFTFPGGRRFHFSDPGGNELAVWTDQ